MRAESGQGVVEWIGLVLLIGVVGSALVAGASGAGLLHGRTFVDTVFERIRCAIDEAVACRKERALEEAYGENISRLVRNLAPELVYEKRTKAMPVDFRLCRKVRCGDGNDDPASITQSDRGLPAAVFTRVVDKRDEGEYLYLQYWMYYADSTSGAGRVPGIRQLIKAGGAYHRDDWESYQLRIDRGGKQLARSSAHKLYTGHKDLDDPNLYKIKDSAVFDPLRCAKCKRWAPETGWHRVSGGSHAGHIPDGYSGERTTPSVAVKLVPLETLEDKGKYDFAVSPPWKKAVYDDPESTSTG